MGSRLARNAHRPSAVRPELAQAVEQYSLNFMRATAPRGGSVELLSMMLSPGSAFAVPMTKLKKAMKEPPVLVGPFDGNPGRNLAAFADHLGLSEPERVVLQLGIAVSSSRDLLELLSSAQMTHPEEVLLLAAMTTGRDVDFLRPAFDSEGPLKASGVLLAGYESPFLVDKRVQSLVLESKLEPGEMLKRFVDVEQAPTLSLEDFAPLQAPLEAVRKVLAGWITARTRGVNLLFHGGTGVGKTEAARAVAKAAGLTLFLANGGREARDSPSPRQRLSSLTIGNSLLRETQSALLFDELEDVAGPRSFYVPADDAVPSKLWMNRLLERNRVPTIWTTNTVDAMDPAFLRRFTLAVEFPPLTERQRRSAFSQLAKDALTPEELQRLASVHELSPGDFGAALTAARLAGGAELDRQTLALALEGSERLRPGRPRTAMRAGGEYRLEAVNASRDLAALAQTLSSWRPGARTGVTLCLSGPSGTGKSEYVHALARRMERPLVVRTCSQLKSKFVGDTERNIARAFEEAQREGALLLFDEVDTFLSDRRQAQHEWERSQANEFLQQLESARGFVAVTTNFAHELDPAVLRRFLFKVEFFPLKPEQHLVLWDAHLAPVLRRPLSDEERKSVAASLAALGPLVPSDFSLVARRIEVLRQEADVPTLLAELAEEAAARRQRVSRPVGFSLASRGGEGGGEEASRLCLTAR